MKADLTSWTTPALLDRIIDRDGRFGQCLPVKDDTNNEVYALYAKELAVGRGGANSYTTRLRRKVVNRPMADRELEAQKSEPERNPRSRKPYSESYRHLYSMRQDVLLKTRQLQWSLDQIVLYVRDLLR